MVLYDDLENTEKLRIYDTGVSERPDEIMNRMRVDYRVGDIWIPKIALGEPLSAMARDFIACCTERKVPRSDGQLACDVVETIEAAENSMRNQSRWVRLENR